MVITGEVFEQRYRSSDPIQVGAAVVHGILDEDLVGCPPSDSAASDFPVGLEYMIGHKVRYDWNTLGQPGVKLICTLAIARDLYPELPISEQELGAEMILNRAAVKVQIGKGDHSIIAFAEYASDWDSRTFTVETSVDQLIWTDISELTNVGENEITFNVKGPAYLRVFTSDSLELLRCVVVDSSYRIDKKANV